MGQCIVQVSISRAQGYRTRATVTATARECIAQRWGVRFFLRVLERDLKTLRETSNVGSVLKKVTIMDLNFGTSMPAFEQVRLVFQAAEVK